MTEREQEYELRGRLTAKSLGNGDLLVVVDGREEKLAVWVFDALFRPVGLPFPIDALRAGRKIRRRSWGSDYCVMSTEPTTAEDALRTKGHIAPYDILATNWEVLADDQP